MALIVCIEDEVTLREDIAEELVEDGHEVLEADDGAAGIELILSRRPDLVISDITMPAMSGFDVLTKVRNEHPELAEMPFIFLSALAGDGDVVEGLRQGADDYLTKPVDFAMMIAMVDARLRQAERMPKQKESEAAELLQAYETLTGEKLDADSDIAWR